MSKTIRIDDDIYEAIIERKHRMDTINDVLGKMLAELGIEPFDEEFDTNE